MLFQSYLQLQPFSLKTLIMKINFMALLAVQHFLSTVRFWGRIDVRTAYIYNIEEKKRIWSTRIYFILCFLNSTYIQKCTYSISVLLQVSSFGKLLADFWLVICHSSWQKWYRAIKLDSSLVCTQFLTTVHKFSIRLSKTDLKHDATTTMLTAFLALNPSSLWQAWPSEPNYSLMRVTFLGLFGKVATPCLNWS